MTSPAETPPDAPNPSEVRAEVERMAMSDVFRTSPQLVSFLRFVVEAVLSGRSDRIKGYTIAVEVLRRDATTGSPCRHAGPRTQLSWTRRRRMAGPAIAPTAVVVTGALIASRLHE